MKYCSQCGGPVALAIPEDDNRERYVCNHCGAIHYENPNVVVGAIPLYQAPGQPPQVLLCKRAIEPRFGYWTLPAGFLENGETMEQGARRETDEESCAVLEDLVLYRLYDVIHARQIHVFYRAVLPEPAFRTTPESSEVQLFSFDEIPWTELAFPTVYHALADFVDAWPDGDFAVDGCEIGMDHWQTMLPR